MPSTDTTTNQLSSHFAQFIKERIYLKNVTDKTVYFHNQALTSFKKNCPHITTIEQLSKSAMTDYIIKLKEGGVKPVSINTYLRSLNAFFAWLHENRLIDEKLKIAKLPLDKELVKTLPDENLSKLLRFTPEKFWERRIHTLILTIIDTGLRITEALTIMASEIDFENTRLRVIGKGRKERLVPCSFDLRKILVKYLKATSEMPTNRYLFCTHDGGPVLYSNARRDYVSLCEKLKIPQLGAFHRMVLARAHAVLSRKRS